jgi:6-phosphofructokinase 2
MSTITTVTVNPAVDRNTAVEHVGPNRKLRCDTVTTEPGGGGINVSRAISILGGESVAIHTAGGPAGDRLVFLLDKAGINHQTVTCHDETRENLTIVENASGDQYRFGMPGPEIDHKEAQTVLDHVENAVIHDGFCVLSGSLAPGLPDDFYAQAARIANRAGARVVVDAGGDPLRAALEEGVFMIKPNVRELDLIAGRELQSDEDRIDAVRDLTAHGRVECVIVSLGSAGALLVTGEEHSHVRSPSVPIRSRIGAGDSMVAGLVHRLSSGSDLLEAVRFGSAAGASAGMTDGTELCRRDTTEELFGKLGGTTENSAAYVG